MADNTNADQEPPPPLYTCSSCKELLHRRNYSKNISLARTENRICRDCRKTANALRIKQKPPPVLLKTGPTAESGQYRKPNNFGYCHYVDRLFGMKSFADIVQLQVFQSAKDVSESMAALQGALKHGGAWLKEADQNKKVLCLCIGDGATPRTAVLCAFLQTNWVCVSIDPAMRQDWHGDEAPKHVKDFVGVQGTLEEFMLDPPTSIQDQTYSSILLLCVHSHARFIGPHCTIAQIRQLLSSNHQQYASADMPSPLLPTTVVSLPCCSQFRHVRDIGVPPQVQYEDDGVFSACRRVELWNFD
jgi:hypothetical protein